VISDLPHRRNRLRSITEIPGDRKTVLTETGKRGEAASIFRSHVVESRADWKSFRLICAFVVAKVTKRNKRPIVEVQQATSSANPKTPTLKSGQLGSRVSKKEHNFSNPWPKTPCCHRIQAH
jgi:hypothetical protein